MRFKAWGTIWIAAACAACDADSQTRASLAAPGPEDAPLMVLVSNEASNDISFIDAETDGVVRTVPVGMRPRGMEVSPDGKTLYVALSGSPRGGPGVDEDALPPPDRTQDGIGVVDLSGSAMRARLPSGNDPEAVDSSPDGRVLVVANEDSAQVRLLRATDGEVLASVPVGLEPEGVAFHPSGRYVYVTSEGNDRVDVVDVDKRQLVTSIGTGKRPRSVAFSSDGERAYVTCEFDARLDVLDAVNHRPLASVDIVGTPKALPMGLALHESEHRVYVSLGRAGEVAVIDTQALRLLRRIPDVGERPWGIALTPDGSKIYTANGPSGDVSVIDAESLQVIRRIQVGQRPWGLALVRGPAG